MSLVHFLNVNNGDCSIVQHNTERVTVIDVCNASPGEADVSKGIRSLSESGVLGNFNQKEYPENPITYMKDRNIKTALPTKRAAVKASGVFGPKSTRRNRGTSTADPCAQSRPASSPPLRSYNRSSPGYGPPSWEVLRRGR
jgi:hypothetical protein